MAEMLQSMIWTISNRCDPDVRPLADRHYNRQSIGADNFVPPGRCVVLKSIHEGKVVAFWVTSWPFAEYTHHAWAGAWMCSAFRREGGPWMASDMVKDAVAITWFYYGNPPPLGFVSFVNSKCVKPTQKPGRCYRKAGWKVAKCPKHELPNDECPSCDGLTAGGLIALQLPPENIPEPIVPMGSEFSLFDSSLHGPRMAV